MNLQRMLDRITSHLVKEADPTLNTIADRTEAINESIRAINLRLKLNRRRITITVTAGTANAPSDLIVLYKIYADTKELAHVAYNDYINYTASTLTSEYYHYDHATRVLAMYPTGSTSIVAEYLADFPALVVQTDLAFEGKYLTLHPIVTLLAANMLFRDRGPEAMATSRFWLSEYEREIKEFERVWGEEEEVPERLVMGYSYPHVPRRREGPL